MNYKTQLPNSCTYYIAIYVVFYKLTLKLFAKISYLLAVVINTIFILSIYKLKLKINITF